MATIGIWLKKAGSYDGNLVINSSRQRTPSGQQLVFTHDRISAAQPAQRAREAWTYGILLAENIRLGDLIEELQPYRRGFINVSDQAAGLRVFGGYPLNDPDQTLAMLAQALPIEVSHTLPWWVSIDVAR